MKLFHNNWQWKRPLVRIPLVFDLFAGLRTLMKRTANSQNCTQRTRWSPTIILLKLIVIFKFINKLTTDHNWMSPWMIFTFKLSTTIGIFSENWNK
ncbi:hypothetical protein T02_11787 [Trichinella nativa]|uniref:Uncharacterized protein n=1 Tax=Trichinella nativa TaxID=6335 RepID=A0A0V1LIX7_9BILA|nr:hypothetical protein T02_11787 [Trichinella nativa]